MEYYLESTDRRRDLISLSPSLLSPFGFILDIMLWFSFSFLLDTYIVFLWFSFTFNVSLSFLYVPLLGPLLPLLYSRLPFIPYYSLYKYISFLVYTYISIGIYMEVRVPKGVNPLYVIVLCFV